MRRFRWWLPLLVVVTTLLTGCAHFPDSGPRNWRDKPKSDGPLAAPPRVPEQDPDDRSPSPAPPAQPRDTQRNGCSDPDPLVVATCLDPVSAIVMLPGGTAALAAQRTSGRVSRVEPGKPSKPLTSIAVDPGGGGLKGLVLSPSYAEDRLLYAYVATPTDNRVLRVTLDGQTTPILTGIPATPGDDSGAIVVGKDGSLVVATGSGGRPSDPRSLAGKILKIDTFGKPFKGNPDARSPVYSDGVVAPGGLCRSPESATVWVTDRAPEQDRLFIIVPGRLGPPAWNWPNKTGVAGCVAQEQVVAVAERGASALFVLQKPRTSDRFTGVPTTLLANTYGRLSAAALGASGLVWLGTENKGRGGPVVSSDDRVIRLPLITGGDSGSGPD